MSDDINKMDFKQLRNEVQLLRDELAIFKRKYEDIIYNLDDDNFSSTLLKEKDGMKTSIEVNAEGIKTKVSKEDLDKSLSAYTTLEQTAEAIKTQAYASADLSSATQINDLSQATNKSKTYYISDGNGNKTYYYYNEISKEWEEIIGGGIETVFEQTADGFKLKGNVLIDGDTVVTENLKLSGNVTWNMDNSPVITQYSADNVNWHSPMVSGDMYMQMSFDGGKSWSTSTKVVGTDGRNGYDGSDANVTPQNVFNALTNSGANQGIFAAFVKNNNQLYINAEMIQAGILSGMTLQNIEGTHSLQMSSSSGSIGEYGTFRLYNDKYSSGVPYFSVFDNELGYTGLLAAGVPFLGVRVSGNTTVEPYGNWDFGGCTITDWGNNAPTAEFG